MCRTGRKTVEGLQGQVAIVWLPSFSFKVGDVRSFGSLRSASRLCCCWQRVSGGGIVWKGDVMEGASSGRGTLWRGHRLEGGRYGGGIVWKGDVMEGHRLEGGRYGGASSGRGTLWRGIVWKGDVMEGASSGRGTLWRGHRLEGGRYGGGIVWKGDVMEGHRLEGGRYGGGIVWKGDVMEGHRLEGGPMMMVVVVAAVMVMGEEGVKGEGVSLRWGVADTTASVGRLFRYHVPGDAFKGHVDRYEVVEAGKDHLPSWLQFLPDQNVLKGIPTPADARQTYLEVTAFGHNGQKASDVFSVLVSSDSPAMSSGQPLRFQKTTTAGAAEVVRCKREEPETVATIVVDADLSGMGAEQRLEMVSKFLAHMGLGEDVVKVVPARAKLLQDDSALVTGSGDVKDPKHPGVALSWLVGCGKVEQGHFPILQKLDDDSGNGVLGRAVGYPVVGWRVTNTRLQQQQHALKRRRRQIRATPTPGVTVTPPTATDARVETDTMTHRVVVMSSPTFPLEPTPTQPDMPHTTTPKTTTTTTEMKKPDTVEPSKPSVKPPVVTETPTLPSTTTTTTTTTTTSTTTTTTPTTTTTTTTTMKPATKKPTKPPVVDCLKPTASRQSTKVVVYEGEVVDYKIPEDLFSACGVGGTSQTSLILFKDMSSKIPDDFFLQFDQDNQRLHGMALGENIGSYNMTLVASLREQAFITTTNLRVSVRRLKGKRSRVNHKMSMTIDTDYDAFVGSVDKKLDLANKVASVYGDENTSALTVTSIERGSVVFSFTNNTLSGGSCPVGDVTALADKLVTPDGQLNPDAQRKLHPWVLTGAAVSPAGSCQGRSDFPSRSASVAEPTHPPPAVTTMKPHEPKTGPVVPPASPDTPGMPDKTTRSSPAPPPNVTRAGKTSEDDIWITTVVPAVVIVAILLIALLIACILYRKKRKGKMNLEDKNTFVNKGAPVIFPDELEDKPNDSTKPLLIEGSPPAPPPEYHRGHSASPESGNYHRDITPPTDEGDAEVDASSPLYQPPPPVTASSGRQARPHVHQPYRSQPPEIHP
ncbi:hypothetical protein ACOMHN_030858 [Nucella lapillus]